MKTVRILCQECFKRTGSVLAEPQDGAALAHPPEPICSQTQAAGPDDLKVYAAMANKYTAAHPPEGAQTEPTPKVCCQDFGACRERCVPRADYWQGQAEQWKAEADLNEHRVITCGVAATHPDPTLTLRGAYKTKWDTQQAEQVRALRARADAAEGALHAPSASSSAPETER